MLAMGLLRQKASSLRLRILTAIVAVPLLFSVIWFGEPWVSIAVAVVAILAINEFYALVSKRWAKPSFTLGVLGVIAMVMNARFGGTDTMPIVSGAVLVIPLLLVPLRRNWREDVLTWAWTMLGVFLFGWTLSFFVAMRGLDFGREWAILTVFSIFAADTGAYFVGKAIGRHQLAPEISPGKTWEGVLGGAAGSLLISVLIFQFMNLPANLAEILGLSAMVAVISPVGDLSESYLKRRVGTKEASELLPGHGGIMDRLDSVVFTLVGVYYYIEWIAD